MASILPRFDFRAEYAVASDVGLTRKDYEDAYLVAPEASLFAVADGMGGHQAGEVAAKLAIEETKAALSAKGALRAIEAYVANADLEARRKVFATLRRAVEKANERIRAEGQEHPERRGMGTTLDVVWLARDHAFIAHAGDGRVYLARSRAMLQLTQDHTAAPVGMSDALGRSSPQPQRSGINNALGLSEAVTVDTLFVDVSRGDRLLLCTDGVHGQLDGEAELSELLREGTPENAVRSLVGRAGETGRDNATAVIIEIGERFVKRSDHDRGLNAEDLESARQSPLLVDLPLSFALNALSAAVEIEVAVGETLPRAVASDLVAYIALDGIVRYADGRSIGAGALIYPESLLGVWGHAEPPVVEHTTRLLRVRADDFAEICTDPRLAAELYRRIALHLARVGSRGGAAPAGGATPAPG